MDSIKCESPSPTRATSSVSAIAARGAHALSYGGGVLRFQTSWWAMQHVSWLRRPGITPTVVDDLVLLVGSVIVRFAPIWAAGLSLSQTWMADPWVCCIPIAFLFIWWCRGPAPRVIEPESEDPPNRQPRRTTGGPPVHPLLLSP